MSLNILIPLLLVFITNDFFNIGSWWHKSGVFNIADIGNAILCVSLITIFPFSKNRKILFNPMSAIILFYLLFVILQILQAYMNYGQSLFDGLVGTRHQFYYLSFFLFLLLLADSEKIVKLLNILVIVSIGALILGIINYFGPTILSHKWAAGQPIRAGVMRAYVPGMDVIAVSTIWLFAKWTNPKSVPKWQQGSAIFFLAGHIFRQTRMRVIAVVATIVAMLIVRKKWKRVFLLLILSSSVFLGFEAYKGENIISNLFVSGYTDLMEQTGTWKWRSRRIKMDLEEFKKHPWIGSGASALRRPTKQKNTLLQIKTAELSYRHDLGYTHWLKFYGIVGALWLGLFFGYQVFVGWQSYKKCNAEERIVVVFALSYLGYVMVSYLTLDHLMNPSRIIFITFCAAILVTMSRHTGLDERQHSLENTP